MNPCAAAVIAVVPTDGVPLLIVSDPSSAKKAATLAAFWLHHAAVYFAPNASSFAMSIAFSVVLQLASAAANSATRTSHLP